MQHLWLISFEILVVESNVCRRLRVNICRKDRIGAQFPEAIEVQLPSEAREVRMLEIQGQYCLWTQVKSKLGVGCEGES